MKIIDLMMKFQKLYPETTGSQALKDIINAVREEEAAKYKAEIRELREILEKIRVLLPHSHSDTGG